MRVGGSQRHSVDIVNERPPARPSTKAREVANSSIVGMRSGVRGGGLMKSITPFAN